MRLSLFALLFAAALFPSTAQADDGWDVNVHLMMAKRQLGTWDDRNFSHDTGDFKNQDVAGGEIDFGADLWPVNVWLGYSRSEKKIDLPEIDFASTLTMTEYYAGARFEFIGFFASGAIASVGGEFTGHTGSATHTVTVERETGFLVNAGYRWTLLVVSVGIDARALTGTQNNDYAQLGLKAGVTF